MRPYQWVKNFFIFLPLIFGKKLLDPVVLAKAGLMFLLFSFAASAVYLVNDVFDREKDKFHRLKRLRPVASGKIKPEQALAAAAALGFAALTGSFLLQKELGLIVLAYIVFNFLYSKVLKDLVIIDVFCIGFFFLLRVLAGTAAAGVPSSYWMIAMTFLLALFLGFNKRRQEIRMYRGEALRQRGVLTKYNVYFIDQMIAVLTSSVVVVYMLYTVDARTVAEFGTTHLLYSIPFVYYGIFRYLYIVHKTARGEDPTRVFFTDRMTGLNLFLWASVCVMVIYFKI